MKISTRYLLIATVILFLVSYFVFAFPEYPGFTPLSFLFIVGMSLPSYLALARWLGKARAPAIISIMSAAAVIVEGIAIVTGLPYGRFSYSDTLGYRLLGLVPWSVAFAYPPILLGAFTAAAHLVESRGWRLVAVATLLTVSVDLVLDPAAVALGFWGWDAGGLYYGVPPINFMGWLVTGALYNGVLLFATTDKIPRDGAVPLDVAYSLPLILSFWTGFALWSGMLLPCLTGLALLGLFTYIYTRKRATVCDNNFRQPLYTPKISRYV